MRSIAVTLLLLLTVDRALGQSPAGQPQHPVRAVATVDRQSALVADPIVLTIQVMAPTGSTVDFPDSPIDLGSFQVHQIRQEVDIPVPGSTERRRWTIVMTIDTVESGEQSIPALSVGYRLPDTPQRLEHVETEPIKVRISSLLEGNADPSNFRDIKPEVDTEGEATNQSAIALWILLSIGVAGLLIAVAIALRRRKPTVTAARWALSQIEWLETSVQHDPFHPDHVYGELARIIREFMAVESDSGLRSLSPDDLRQLASEPNRTPPHVHQQLSQLLSLADEVRFAQLGQSGHDVTAAISTAKHAIRMCEAGGEDVPDEALRMNPKPDDHFFDEGR